MPGVKGRRRQVLVRDAEYGEYEREIMGLMEDARAELAEMQAEVERGEAAIRRVNQQIAALKIALELYRHRLRGLACAGLSID